MIYTILPNLLVGPIPRVMPPADAILCMIRTRTDISLGLSADRYRCFPIPDSEHVDIRVAEAAVQQILVWFDMRYTVYLHCRAGQNRSPLVAAMVVRRLKNMTGEAAMEYVRQRRPNALTNPYFAIYLASLPAPAVTLQEMRAREVRTSLQLMEHNS